MNIIKKISITVLLLWAVSTTAHAATFSQTNVSLSVGQTTTVYAYNTSSSLYISNNSNSNIATVSINGATVSIYGNTSGSTSVTICESYSYYTTYNCTPIYITVDGYNNWGYNYSSNNLGFIVSNLILSIGDSLTLSSPNQGQGILSVQSNSNPNVVVASATTVIPGCVLGALYSTYTGQPCYNTSSQYMNSSYIPGCTAGALYSTYTGQPCYGGGYGYNNQQSSSLTISAVSLGQSTITVCQNSNVCTPITILVNR